MIDRRRIIRQWRQGTSTVLVTLVRIEGSSYRRAGAHLLVGTGGEYTGTISGGCLESEVVRKATWAVRHGAAVERYSTLFDDTAEIPYGLGCGGVVHLLLEPVGTPECEAFLKAMDASLSGVECVVATWLPDPGTALRRAVIGADGRIVFASADLNLDVAASIPRLENNDASRETPPGVYVERLCAPQRLLVFGAGDDARPLVTMASLLGWSVVVVDGRTQLARPERFPEAERVCVVEPGAGPVQDLNLRSQDAAVLLTHSYEQDRAWLAALLAGAVPGSAAQVPGYIGLLGARHRSSLLVSEVASAVGLSVSDCCARIWAPVGLDLGGDGPEAIALAAIAEVQASVQGRLGQSRRLNAEDVAEQVAKGGTSSYLRSHCAVDLVRS